MTEHERMVCIVALCLLAAFIGRRAIVRPLVLLVRVMLLCGLLAVVALAMVG